jgi:hypothetical protein
MPKPLFSVLKANHYSSDADKPGHKNGEELYEEMGLSDFYTRNYAAYRNTCAARMSLALLKSGVSIAGRIQILAGAYKGKKIEPGAKLLADQLVRIFGPVLGKKASKNAFFSRAGIQREVMEYLKKPGCGHGVIFFNNITDYNGGHIDLIEHSTAIGFVCNSSCYFMCKEVWYWPLP